MQVNNNQLPNVPHPTEANQINNMGQQQPELLVDQDPFGPSYHQSAIKYLPYRIGILVFACVMIVIGKSNLPSDSVPCIEDTILDWLQPVTNFYIANQGFGLTLVSIMQLLVDIQLVGMLIYWFTYGESMRYPIVLGIIGISKILLNVLFQTKAIDKSFTQQAFPSIVFGQNFINTYFFSGVACLLMANLLELYQEKHKKWFVFQLVVMVYIVFVLLSARQNYFMDIATAIVFTHYVYYFINDRTKSIDGVFFRLYDKIIGRKEDEQEDVKAHAQV